MMRRLLSLLVLASLLGASYGTTPAFATSDATSVQRPGCFVEASGAGGWQQTQCIAAPTRPFLPAIVGNGNDKVADASSLIGSATGSFQSVTGLVNETGDAGCIIPYAPNCYSVQLNTDFFAPVSTNFTDYRSGYALSWEQFIYVNLFYYKGIGIGFVFIQYWLVGYHAAYGQCPSNGPPGGSPWIRFRGHCFANSPGALTFGVNATDLGRLRLQGFANYGGSGNDEVRLCVTGGICTSVKVDAHVLNLYQNWHGAEFNIVGGGNASQAVFNPGTSIVVSDILTDGNGNLIEPSCDDGGTTGETNNLFLGSCAATGSGIVFVEGLPGGQEELPLAFVPQPTSVFLSCTGPVKLGEASNCDALVLGTFGAHEGGILSFFASAPGAFDRDWCYLSLQSRNYQSCGVHFTPSSAVPFTPSTTPLTIMAFYAGDSNNRPSAGSYDVNLDPAPTGVTGNCGSDTLLIGATATCTTTVIGTSPGSFGNVSLSQVGGNGVVSISQSQCKISLSQCQLAISGVRPGRVDLEVTYTGDTTDMPSAGTFTITVNTVVVTCTSALYVGRRTTCIARVVGTPTPTGVISWASSGRGRFTALKCRLVQGVCSVGFTPASRLPNFIITATYSGDRRNPSSFGAINLPLR